MGAGDLSRQWRVSPFTRDKIRFHLIYFLKNTIPPLEYLQWDFSNATLKPRL
jgi:hypothetical protein